MPHHLWKSGLLERAAQMTAGMGKRNSDRAAPTQRGQRGGGGAWARPGRIGKHIPLRTASLKSQPRDPTGQDAALCTPNTDQQPMQLTPGGAVMSGPWQYKHIKQAHIPRPPRVLLLRPSVQPGSFFFQFLVSRLGFLVLCR